MDKKGFTLIELVTTIGLMVLMGVIIVNNITALYSNQEEATYQDFRKQLENAACTYIDLSDNEIKQLKSTCRTSGCDVAVKTLIERGLLDEDVEDPWTGDIIGNEELHVHISYPDKEKTCEFQE